MTLQRFELAQAARRKAECPAMALPYSYRALGTRVGLEQTACAWQTGAAGSPALSAKSNLLEVSD